MKLRTWRRWTPPLLVLAAVAMSACFSTVRVSYEDQPEVQVGAALTVAAVAAPTLDLFWHLARIQVEDVSGAPPLLRAEPEEVEEILEARGAGFEAFRDELAKAGLRPVVLFVPKGADPLAAARARGLAIPDGAGSPPPALLSGPELDTLVLFHPLDAAAARSSPWSAAAGPRFASLGAIPGPRVAPDPAAGTPATSPLRLYRVQPRTWHPEVVFEHTRCVAVLPEAELVTRLVYGGGDSDSEVTSLSGARRRPCPFAADPSLAAVVVEQRGRPKARQPVVIAASYVLDPHPGPLLADWVVVE